VPGMLAPSATAIHVVEHGTFCVIVHTQAGRRHCCIHEAAAASTGPEPSIETAGLGLLAASGDCRNPWHSGALALVRVSPATGDLRSSAGLSTWRSCFVCASDTGAPTGQLVAEPGVAYAHERLG
jgi:hypothetical protein